MLIHICVQQHVGRLVWEVRDRPELYHVKRLQVGCLPLDVSVQEPSPDQLVSGGDDRRLQLRHGVVRLCSGGIAI